MRRVEELQREVWGYSERDVVPAIIFKPNVETGAILVGAFDRDAMVGFAYGFVGLENGRPIIHSDMLAVKDGYRNRQLGYKLKLAQRERALVRGISTITWTFDPLQGRNAHLNFSRLGVISRRYEIDYYGPETSSFLHRNMGTDRLWVHWLLESERVRRLMEERGGAIYPSVEVEPLVRLERDGSPRLVELTEIAVESHALIEIPYDINLLQEQNPQLAAEWRRATRRAFSWALRAGYFVEEFYHSKGDDSRSGIYLLSKCPEDSA